MFSFDVQPSYDLIFSNTTEERVFEHYLGIPVKKGMFKNPMREDKHPSSSFFRTKRGLYFRDHALNINYGCIDVVTELFACGYLEAIEIICNDFNLIDTNTVKNAKKIEYTNKILDESESAVLQCSFKSYSKKELEWWAQFGITEKTLKEYNVLSVKNLFVNGELRIMNSDERMLVFGYYFGKENGVEQWKVYMPKRHVRFYCNTTKFQGVKQLRKNTDTLIITSSMKDVMALREAGFEAIAPQSESVNITEDVKRKLEKIYPNIYVFYDHDNAGIELALKITAELGWTSFTTGDGNLKDPADFSKQHGIEALANHVNEQITRIKACTF